MSEPVLSVDAAQLVAVAGDAIIAADAHGAIVLWNAAAERIFGYTQAEAIGQTLDLITPERHRKRHWHGYETSMRTGQTRYGAEVLRVPALRKDGGSISIAFTVAMLRDADDKVDAIVAVIRDETARWNAERDLRRRLGEFEAAAAHADAAAST